MAWQCVKLQRLQALRDLPRSLEFNFCWIFVVLVINVERWTLIEYDQGITVALCYESYLESWLGRTESERSTQDQQAAVPVVQILNLLCPRTHLEVTSLANGWGNLRAIREDARLENFWRTDCWCLPSTPVQSARAQAKILCCVHQCMLKVSFLSWWSENLKIMTSSTPATTE